MRNSKKILILGPDLKSPGGVANYFNVLDLHREDNICYFAVNKPAKQSFFSTAIRLIKNYWKYFIQLVKYRIGIVHLNPSLDKRSFYRDAVFIILAHLLRKKTLIFFRGWKDDFENKIKKSKLLSSIFKLTYGKASKYIVLSETFKDKILDMGVSKDKHFYIESTVADSKYLPDLDLQKKIESFEKEVKILFLSRIEKEKGIYIALNAYNNIVLKYPDRKFTFIVAGDGPELPAVKKYSCYKKMSNVCFTGYVRGELKKKVLLESHIMLFPTYYGEGLPNTILEGMMYGMPIVSRKNAGIGDVVVNCLNGFLTESRDPIEFSEFLSELIEDKKLYEEISKNNHKVAMEKYTSEKVRERILSIYDSFH